MTDMAGFQSFDDMTAAAAGNSSGIGIDSERIPPNYINPTTPNPSQLVSDHSAEGAPYLPAARSVPELPPAPAMWSAEHDYDGYYPAYDTNASNRGHAVLGPGNDLPHQGVEGGTNPVVWGPNKAQPNAYGLINIGAPYLATEQNIRHLRTSNEFDPVTGKNINPDDAPSAPVQLWNSQHNTEPRWIPFGVAPLFENIGKGPQFSNSPGYLGVSDNAPNRAPRQWGSEVAQMPDDPYVYQGASSGPAIVDYGWDF
jgi:hypothetical protein